MRAKLFFKKSAENEFTELGIGQIRVLPSNREGMRVVMRNDTTLAKVTVYLVTGLVSLRYLVTVYLVTGLVSLWYLVTVYLVTGLVSLRYLVTVYLVTGLVSL